MDEALRFFKDYEFWIYLLLALGGLVYIRKFVLAWDELRGAAFGLERESAQSRLNQAASMLVLLLAMGVTVFVLVSFVVPTVPGANPLLTPTLDLFATTTTTLPVNPTLIDTTQETTNITTPSTVEPSGGEGCIPGELMISEPKDGTEISGVVTLKGTANIPNFGFYKYEVARPGETIWLTIQAGREVVQDDELGQWDTRTLSSGDYMLRLVVTDNQGESSPPCVIHIYVNNPVTP